MEFRYNPVLPDPDLERGEADIDHQIGWAPMRPAGDLRRGGTLQEDMPAIEAMLAPLGWRGLSKRSARK